MSDQEIRDTVRQMLKDWDRQADRRHVHSIEHMPQGGTGYAVCSCGATLQVVNGQPTGSWHTCALCTHSFGLA